MLRDKIVVYDLAGQRIGPTMTVSSDPCVFFSLLPHISVDPYINEYYHCLPAGSISVNVSANTNGTGSINTKPRYVSSSFRNEPLKLILTAIVVFPHVDNKLPAFLANI